MRYKRGMLLTMVNGDKYEAVRVFGDGLRAIVLLEGAYVMVDQIAPSGWDFSSEPARPGPELEALNQLVKALEAQGTVVTVTKGES